MKKNKRRQKSVDELLAQQFLKEQTKTIQKTVRMAWGIDVVAVLIFVVQAYWLAWLFGGLLADYYAGVNAPLLARFWQALPWLAGCLLVRPLLFALKEKLVHGAGLDMAQNVRKQGLARLGELGLARSFYGSDGALAAHIVDEPDSLMGYARFLVQKLSAVSTPVMIALVIGTKSIMAAALLLATAPIVPVFMAFIGIATARKSRAQMDALASLGGRFLDWLRGMNTLDRLKAVPIASLDVERAAEDYKERTMSVLKIAFLNSAVLEFFSALSIALVAVYLGFGLMGILPWATGEVVIDYQAALFILLLVPEFYAPLRKLGAEYHAKGAAEGCAKKLAPMLGVSEQSPLNEVASSQVALSQVASSQVPPKSQADALSQEHSKDTQTILGDDLSIVLDDLSVYTAGRQRVAGVTLGIEHTKRVAIIGKSGSGKSTILQVLLGFCEYTGSVRVGGNELAKWDKTTLRDKIGYLPQVPALLPMSIADNLRLAKPNATDEELNFALREVEMLQVVRDLPEGIHSKLLERGGGLSGGQAQRIAIAQLLLQDAKIWLLDEPTEHLDAETKGQIHALFAKLSQDKSLIWVTHDTPVSWLDTVYSLEELTKSAPINQTTTANDKGVNDETI